MKSIIFGIVFWAVMLGAVRLIRPGSKLLGITMERWTIWHRLATVLVLAALIGSESFLMTLCPMWNGEITAQLMEQIEERKAGKKDAEGAVGEKSESPAVTAGEEKSESPAVTAGEEKWKAMAADALRAGGGSDKDQDPDRFAIKNKDRKSVV